MAANENTKLQVNYKVGNTMVNIYAIDQADLEKQLTTVQDLAALITSTDQILAGVGSLTAVSKAVEEPVWAAKTTTPVAAAPAASGPTCKHGAMTYKEGVSAKTGKPWKAWMCPSPKGTPDQCPADFIR